jgi:hypothetical protein
MVDRRAVLIEHHGTWLRGSVLWTYNDFGRLRALVRYDTPAGLTLRELRWADELRRPRCLILPVVAAAIARSGTRAAGPPAEGRRRREPQFEGGRLFDRVARD